MAAEEQEEGKEGEGQEEAKPKKKGKLIIIIAAVVVLVVGGVVGFLFMGGKEQPPEGEEGAEHAEEAEHEMARVEMKPFIVNLSSSTSYLKAVMVLEYDPALVEGGAGHGEEGAAAAGGGHGGGGHGGGGGDEAKALPGVLGSREAIINDAIIRVLSSKSTDAVLTPDGKEQLKEELVEAINDASGLDEAAVSNVYFTDFIIQ